MRTLRTVSTVAAAVLLASACEASAQHSQRAAARTSSPRHARRMREARAKLDDIDLLSLDIPNVSVESCTDSASTKPADRRVNRSRGWKRASPHDEATVRPAFDGQAPPASSDCDALRGEPSEYPPSGTAPGAEWLQNGDSRHVSASASKTGDGTCSGKDAIGESSHPGDGREMPLLEAHSPSDVRPDAGPRSTQEHRSD